MGGSHGAPCVASGNANPRSIEGCVPVKAKKKWFGATREVDAHGAVSRHTRVKLRGVGLRVCQKPHTQSYTLSKYSLKSFNAKPTSLPPRILIEYQQTFIITDLSRVIGIKHTRDRTSMVGVGTAATSARILARVMHNGRTRARLPVCATTFVKRRELAGRCMDSR